MSAQFDRRRFMALSGLGLGATALAACSGPSTSGGSGATAAAATDWSKVKPAAKISFMSSHPGTSQPIEQTLIDAFQSANPDIKVDLITGGSNYEEVAQKFQTAQAGNNVPDVVVASDVWWFRYSLSSTIVPVDEILKAVNDKTSDYNTTLYDDYKYDNAHWAVPYARSTPLFYYNKDHFKAAGVPDRAPKSWEEFAQWAPKIKAANAGQPGYANAYQYPALAGYAGWTLQNVLWGYGGGWSKEWDITADSDATVKALQWVQDTIVKDGWAGVSSKDAVSDMTAGAVSSTVSSTGDLVGTIKAAKAKNMNIGVGFLPGGPVSTSPVCPTGGAGLVIAKKTSPERQLASAMFVSFMTNAANTAQFSAATGYMPVRTTADMSSVISKTPEIQVALDQLKVTKSQDYARVFLPGADQEMAKAAAKFMNEKADVKATMTALSATLEGIYNKDVKPKLKS
ncbi:ABC transporter substrate-binding protein [Paeniglutamicibacter antarcticus]|uniref:ABC transporter substrate-binding protein n=1 Tax=Arthrobacter terrae TaxID=2935737 RepID=A0A931CUC8_9MICC|nr:ABC transporter substrate-binding protein [Arthrobacter terrae]MBG0740018.1 ABC transporter substrate-binding protein [Arthrobacter terrae]